VLSAYIDWDEEEIDLKADDARKPVSIIFPYSYAILETILSYMVAAFFQEPIFRYEGVSPEDELGAIMLEKVVDVHCNKSKVALNLHTMFRDAMVYGMGIVVPTWVKRKGRRTVKEEKGFFSSFRDRFVAQGFRKVTEDVVLFEGNDLINIDPYLALPDPNVSIHEIQKGEFFGWGDRTNYMSLLREEGVDDELFNVQFLRNLTNKESSIFTIDASERDLKNAGPWRDNNPNVSTPLDVIYMTVDLIPKEWELSNKEYPEKWSFGLGADEVVVKAQPLDLDHDLLPVAVCAPDFDGYSTSPVSRMEILYGLQETLDWMFNTHIKNVRKAVNDMLVVDPYLININDVKNPEPGKLIRTRRPAWGKGVKDAVQQLNVVDITRGHVADSAFIVNWMQKIGGADDASMGSLRVGGPERLTGQEFKGTQARQFSRMERIAKLIGLQSMQDIGYMFASHTQQMMDEPLYVTTTGRWREVLETDYGESVSKGRMEVSPFDLLVDYDLKVRDGSVPGGGFNEVWIKLFEIITATPALEQRFDSVRIFKHIAKNSGAKNVDEFVRMQVVPDEQALRNKEAGNLLTLDEAIGGL
jgi:hypothetical protein